MQWINGHSPQQSEKIMRHYIRHPVDIPIEVIPENSPLALPHSVDDTVKIEKMENISFGGLMFQSAIPYTQNKVMRVKISSVNPEFDAYATVSWCRKSGKYYLVGLEFTDKDSEFKIRMVEQVCHIMHYRKHILATEGRELDSSEAAREWIAQYAADFPKQ